MGQFDILVGKIGVGKMGLTWKRPGGTMPAPFLKFTKVVQPIFYTASDSAQHQKYFRCDICMFGHHS